MKRRSAIAVGAGLAVGTAAALAWFQVADDDGAARATQATTRTSGSPTTATRSTAISTSTTLSASTTTTSVPAPPGDTSYAFPIDPEGVASYGRSHHDYPATDVFAPCGTDYVSPTDGVVHELSRTDQWDPANDTGATRGGLFVSVVGDDGVRYYASHLAEVVAGLAAGDRVTAGERLGAVGNTGNARGIDCHVHFGLSPPCEPGEWSVRRGTIYPWPYLDSWRDGGARSPSGEVQAWAGDHPDACAAAEG